MDAYEAAVFDRWDVNSGEKNKKDLLQLDKSRRTQNKAGMRLCKAKQKKGGYIHLYGQLKHNGDLRSYLHDTIINACTYIDVPLTKNELYKMRPPRRTKDTPIHELMEVLQNQIGFSRDMRSFAHLSGGIEFNLIKCMDAKIRLVVATVEDVEETTVHAFIHVAKKLENINEPHVAALVDNRKKHPSVSSKIVMVKT